MLRSCAALLATAGIVSAGCGGPAWPSRGTTVADPEFASHHNAVGSVDVLPLDLQIFAESGVDADLEAVRSRADERIMNSALDALAKRAYGVNAMIDWNGDYPGGNAMTPAQTQGTVAALARYAENTEAHPGTLPIPYLPARLGETTHSDATLYVGGWAFLAAHHESTANKIAKGIAIALVVVAVVALVVIAADALDSKSSKSSGRSSGGGGGGGVRDHRAIGNGGADPVPVVTTHPWGDHPREHHSIYEHHASSDHHAAFEAAQEVTEGVLDVLSDTPVEVEVEPHPDWSAQAEGHGTPQLFLEMTLVDNRTGTVLWHAHQIFPANANDPGQAARAARVLLTSLPAR